MTDDQKLQAFCEGVAGALADRLAYFHPPDATCFNGECIGPGMCPMGPTCRRGFGGPQTQPMECNWKDIFVLVGDFFIHGPEVDEIWKRAALGMEFDPDALQEICLGVFVGGGGKRVKFSGPTKLMHAFAALSKTLEGLADKVKELNCALAGKKP